MLTFYSEEFYLAVSRYCQVFRGNADQGEVVFASSKGNITSMRHALDWMKQNVLSDLCTVEELRGLTAKSFRKCYRLWGKAHPEQVVRDGVDRNQDHSQAVAESNYDVSAHQQAAVIAGGIIDSVRASSINEPELMPPPTVRII